MSFALNPEFGRFLSICLPFFDEMGDDGSAGGRKKVHKRIDKADKADEEICPTSAFWTKVCKTDACASTIQAHSFRCWKCACHYIDTRLKEDWKLKTDGKNSTHTESVRHFVIASKKADTKGLRTSTHNREKEKEWRWQVKRMTQEVVFCKNIKFLQTTKLGQITRLEWKSISFLWKAVNGKPNCFASGGQERRKWCGGA